MSAIFCTLKESPMAIIRGKEKGIKAVKSRGNKYYA